KESGYCSPGKSNNRSNHLDPEGSQCPTALPASRVLELHCLFAETRGRSESPAPRNGRRWDVCGPDSTSECHLRETCVPSKTDNPGAHTCRIRRSAGILPYVLSPQVRRRCGSYPPSDHWPRPRMAQIHLAVDAAL